MDLYNVIQLSFLRQRTNLVIKLAQLASYQANHSGLQERVLYQLARKLTELQQNYQY